MRQNSLSIIFITVAALMILTAQSCKKSSKSYEEQEAEIIQQFIDKNPEINFEKKPSGLFYYEAKTGTGISPVTGDSAWVYYSLYRLSGSMIESNSGTGDPLIYQVDKGELISGFDEGVTYMKEGGLAIIIVPSGLGYGSRGTYAIPGYTPLLFELELVKVKHPSK